MRKEVKKNRKKITTGLIIETDSPLSVSARGAAEKANLPSYLSRHHHGHWSLSVRSLLKAFTSHAVCDARRNFQDGGQMLRSPHSQLPLCIFSLVEFMYVGLYAG